MRPRQSSLGIRLDGIIKDEYEASMRPRQSSLGIRRRDYRLRVPDRGCFNEAEAIKPRNLEYEHLCRLLGPASMRPRQSSLGI